MPVERTRRALLGSLGASTTAVAGCLGNDGPRAGLGKLQVDNHRREPMGVRVAVETDGTQVYERVHRLEAPEDRFRTEIQGEWLGKTVSYAVTVSVTDGSLAKTVTTADVRQWVEGELSMDCYGLAFNIYQDQILVRFFPQVSCPTPESEP